MGKMIRMAVLGGLALGLGLLGCAPLGGKPLEEDPQRSGPAADRPENDHTQWPQIDGSIQEGEWEGAEMGYFEDGAQLFLIREGDQLFVAVRAEMPGMIAGNVFLKAGDQIRIMHTSAALGTAVYQPAGESWRKTKDFDWCCRGKADSPASRASRSMFFDQEGWLGINSFLGQQNELEYQIRLDGAETALAVNYLYADRPESKGVWPGGLSDGVSWPAAGGFPAEMDFSPQNWYDLSGLESIGAELDSAQD